MCTALPASILRCASLRRLYLGVWHFPDTSRASAPPRGPGVFPRLQELGIYFDLSDTDDIFTEEEDSFETLTQLLTRRQREEAISDTPQTERGEQQQ